MAAATPKRQPSEIQSASLDRAENGQSLANYAAIFEGMAERGIPEELVHPRIDVFTLHAWGAKGRKVLSGKGQGVRTQSWISKVDKETGEIKRIPKTGHVYHISQTRPAEMDPGLTARRWGSKRGDPDRPGDTVQTDDGPGEVVWLRTGGKGFSELVTVGVLLEGAEDATEYGIEEVMLSEE